MDVLATKDQPTLYFFVARKSEVLLCQDFQAEIQAKLNYPLYGEINSFTTLFKVLMELSQTRSFNLILDEFQEFLNINPSVYSDMQHLWDVHKEDSKLNLFLCGSVFSLMNKIFEHAKEPLFGRADHRLHLKPFSVSVLKDILKDHHPECTSEDRHILLHSGRHCTGKLELQTLSGHKVKRKRFMLHYGKIVINLGIGIYWYCSTNLKLNLRTLIKCPIRYTNLVGR